MPHDPKNRVGAPPELPPLIANAPSTDVLPRNTLEPMRFRLRIVHKSAWRVELTGDEATIGHGAATIRVPEVGGVSRVHMRLFFRHARWSFEDVSTNGVYELDANGDDTGQLVRGVDGWAPGRGYRIGSVLIFMELMPSADEVRRGFHGLIGDSEQMQEVHKLIKRVGPHDATVILHGESGTGKELVAAALHAVSPRSRREMICVNCASYEENLVESALFGHVKGAFTGADKDHQGAFFAANGSTLFMDEIAEMKGGIQAKVLRVLEKGEFSPVGSQQVIRVDFRLIVASHQHLSELVRAGKFREDLFARLDVVTLRLPPLAERLDDIPALLEFFSRKYDEGRGVTWSSEALAVIKARRHPHNVRGIRNLVQRTLVLHPDVRIIEPRILELGGDVRPPKPMISDDDPSYLYLPKKTLKAVTRETTEKAILRNGNNKTAAAEELGVVRGTVRNLLQGDAGEDDED